MDDVGWGKMVYL